MPPCLAIFTSSVERPIAVDEDRWSPRSNAWDSMSSAVLMGGVCTKSGAKWAVFATNRGRGQEVHNWAGSFPNIDKTFAWSVFTNLTNIWVVHSRVNVDNSYDTRNIQHVQVRILLGHLNRIHTSRREAYVYLRHLVGVDRLNVVSIFGNSQITVHRGF